jgi:hypothetical protein
MLQVALSCRIGSEPIAQKSNLSLEELSNGLHESLLNSVTPVQQRLDHMIRSYLCNASKLFLGTIERECVAHDNDRSALAGLEHSNAMREHLETVGDET